MTVKEPTGPHHDAVPTPHPRRSRRRWVLAGGVILVVLGGTILWRYVPPIAGVRDARTTAAELSARVKTLAPGDVTVATVAELRGLVDRLDAQIAPAADLLESDPIVGLLRGFGPVADQVAGADALVAASGDLVEAAGLGLDLGERIAALRESGSDNQGLIAGMVGVIAEDTASVERMADLLQDAVTALGTVPPGAASQLLEARDLVLEPLERYLPLLEGYRSIDDRLPAILGHDRPRRYLVLAQNPAELRPTGGFIGTYGLLTLDDGSIGSMEFHDIYTIDQQPGTPWQAPPEELQAYLLGRGSWEVADSNWSPDFPTAAADALRLYTIETGDTDIDGVIAITTYALDRLLEVTGPVEVPGTGVTVKAGEVTVAGIANTRPDSTVAEGGADRKRFLSLLADEVLHRLFDLDASRWGDLLAAAADIGEQRLALAWFPDAADQAVVDGSDWSGRVRQDGTDYLAVVDANVSPSSKLSPVVARSTDLAVRIAEDGSAEHALRLEWHSDADREGEPYQTLRAASDSAAGQYGVLPRVLVPLDSEIIEVTGDSVLPVSGVEFETEVAGRRAWGNYLLVEPGMTAWLEDTWTTPGVTEPDGDGQRYHLVIQKQPGQVEEAVRVSIEVPEGATITGTTDGMTVEGTTATWQGTLIADQELEVRFAP